MSATGVTTARTHIESAATTSQPQLKRARATCESVPEQPVPVLVAGGVATWMTERVVGAAVTGTIGVTRVAAPQEPQLAGH